MVFPNEIDPNGIPYINHESLHSLESYSMKY